jgi:hypothetical protein
MLTGDRLLRTAPDPATVPTALHVAEIAAPQTPSVA